MSLVRVYFRVLALLQADVRLAVVLVLANIALAGAQFVEPVLFGRIVDTLASVQGAKVVPGWSSLLPQLALWVAFGAFNIGVGVLVALNADRLSHRRRLAVMAEFFEHVLTLPLLFHTATHSGRALKVMSDGSLSLGGIWPPSFASIAPPSSPCS